MNDAHCHFFSSNFFATLARDVKDAPADPAVGLPNRLGWDPPGTDDTLADRWVARAGRVTAWRRAALDRQRARRREDRSRAAVARRPVAVRRLLHGRTRRRPTPASRADGRSASCGLRGRLPVSGDAPLSRWTMSGCAGVSRSRAAAHRRRGVRALRRALGRRAEASWGCRAGSICGCGDPLGVARAGGDGYPSVPFIIPHFGAGLPARGADGGRRVRQRPPRHVQLEQRGSRSYPGLTLDDGVPAARWRSAGPSRRLFGTDSSFLPARVAARRLRCAGRGAPGARDERGSPGLDLFGGASQRFVPGFSRSRRRRRQRRYNGGTEAAACEMAIWPETQ